MLAKFLSLSVISIFLLLTLVYGSTTPYAKTDYSKQTTSKSNATKRYHIATFDWEHVRTPLTISIWILIASIAKTGFHVSKRLSSVVPDSSLLIVLGLVLGLLLFFAHTKESNFHLGSEIFFLFLLPPIVFDAGYFMPNRAFFDNLGTILCYAVLGTLWNTLTIGFSLYAVSVAGVFRVGTPLLHLLLFSSLISAVDPVAVLVVFEEIHVNEVLFIVVFGESLLNDAVTVVLYHMFESFADIGAENIKAVDIINGLVSFFAVGLGGVVIGLIWAALISFMTRWTKRVRVLEPLFVFTMAYCSYLMAEMFHLSGILAIVFCGIAMKQYVKENISPKSQTTVKYFLKMLSSSSETIIFMFLGLSTVTTYHFWDTSFVGLTVLFCLVYRAIGVVIQTFFINKHRLHKLNKVDQFIMAYGGLRGAIAYGLVVALPEDLIEAKPMFVTACIVVIYFTVFLQGMTIKPLVNLLKVKKEDKRRKTMNEHIFDRLVDHTLAGLEDIAAQKGHHWIRDKYEHYNTLYLKPLLMREAPKTRDMKLVRSFTRLSMIDAVNHMKKTGSFGGHSPGSLSNFGDAAGDDFEEMASYNNPTFEVHSPETLTPNHLDGTFVVGSASPSPVRDVSPRISSRRIAKPGLRSHSFQSYDRSERAKNNAARTTDQADRRYAVRRVTSERSPRKISFSDECKIRKQVSFIMDKKDRKLTPILRRHDSAGAITLDATPRVTDWPSEESPKDDQEEAESKSKMHVSSPEINLLCSSDVVKSQNGSHATDISSFGQSNAHIIEAPQSDSLKEKCEVKIVIDAPDIDMRKNLSEQMSAEENRFENVETSGHARLDINSDTEQLDNLSELQ